MGFAWVHTSEPARQHSPFACGRDVDGVAFAVGAVGAVGAAQRAIKFGFLTFSLKSGKLVGGGGRPGRGDWGRQMSLLDIDIFDQFMANVKT